METLLQIQSQIESQCDTFEKLKDSLLDSVACPEIVCDNFICIMSLLANSRNHIQYEINQKVSLYVNRKRNECSRVQNVPQITLKRKQQEIINDLRTKKVKVCLKKIKLPVKTIESQTKIKIKTEKNVDEDTASDDMENSFSDEEPIDDMENGFTDENFIEVDYNIIKEEIKIEDNPIEDPFDSLHIQTDDRKPSPSPEIEKNKESVSKKHDIILKVGYQCNFQNCDSVINCIPGSTEFKTHWLSHPGASFKDMAFTEVNSNKIMDLKSIYPYFAECALCPETCTSTLNMKDALQQVMRHWKSTHANTSQEVSQRVVHPLLPTRVPLSELKQSGPIEVEPMKDDLNLNTVAEVCSPNKRKITVRKFFDED